MNQQVDPTRITWKVSLLGNNGSGKSALIARIVYDVVDYNAQFRTLTRKVIQFDSNGKKMKADLLLQELDPSPNSEKLLLGSSAIIVTVDITDENSYHMAEDFLRYITTFEKSPLKMVVATKLDRKYEAKIWDPELDDLSSRYGIKVFKASAKSGDGISEFLEYISSELSGRIKKAK